jgi:hypothetical protein
MLFYFLSIIPLLWLAWAFAFPQEAMPQITHWKRLFSQYLLQHMIRHETRLIKDRYRQWGKKHGYQPKLIEEVFNRYAPKGLERIKQKYFLVSLEELLGDEN